MAKKKSTATRRQEAQAASTRAAAIRQAQERKERRRRSLVVTGAGVVVLALVVVIFTVYRGSQDTSGTTTGSSTPSGAGSGYVVPVGSASAPTTVSVYEDFLCPFCGELEAATRAKLQAGIDAGDVRVQYHVLNFLDRNSTNKYSLRAANALAVVLDASGPKVAKKFHDLLYENQPQEGTAGLSDGQLVDYAVQAGAQRSAVSGGISGQRYATWVENGTNQASQDGVSATPTVKINGRTLPPASTAALAAQIERAVAKGRG
jgi:protein-disulfide isomerase